MSVQVAGFSVQEKRAVSTRTSQCRGSFVYRTGQTLDLFVVLARGRVTKADCRSRRFLGWVFISQSVWKLRMFKLLQKCSYRRRISY